ncbi:hypothetical protein COLO4_03222 [Corchorus olitorius]|uniref:Uncharacterized protein n=1 Tax=Corchorus olitorius TaxID=93759 RepID=A0A1R3KZB0_9ROSI|nr:hypothetical protein COLO4_03222 [Corchorus olitorius]
MYFERPRGEASFVLFVVRTISNSRVSSFSPINSFNWQKLFYDGGSPCCDGGGWPMISLSERFKKHIRSQCSDCLIVQLLARSIS